MRAKRMRIRKYGRIIKRGHNYIYKFRYGVDRVIFGVIVGEKENALLTNDNLKVICEDISQKFSNEVLPETDFEECVIKTRGKSIYVTWRTNSLHEEYIINVVSLLSDEELKIWREYKALTTISDN